jgi:hypothetical protein
VARKFVHFVADWNTNQTPIFFDTPRNTTVKQEGSSAVLIKMSGLYYNYETFHFKSINRVPISGPNLKVTSITMPSKISRIIFSCPMGTGGPFPSGKAWPGRDADQSPPSSAQVMNEQELYFLSPPSGNP